MFSLPFVGYGDQLMILQAVRDCPYYRAKAVEINKLFAGDRVIEVVLDIHRRIRIVRLEQVFIYRLSVVLYHVKARRGKNKYSGAVLNLLYDK